MYQLTPLIRPYPWGSRHELARLTGRPAPTPGPEAELWLGAHPQSPSHLSTDTAAGSMAGTLDRLIRAHPRQTLGPACARRFGPRLPFLLKILAIEHPLSIQCHPSTGQVRTAPPGTYPDPWGKPEAVLALTDVELFAGLLPHPLIQARIAQLRIPALTRLAVPGVTGTDPTRALLARLLHLPAGPRRQLARDVVTACHQRRDPALAAIASAGAEHPGDIGPVVLLTMRHHVLAPGAYLHLAPGTLHTYLHGTAVEAQASSDNVTRAGLTGKPVDPPELLRILDTTQRPRPEQATPDGRTHTYPAHGPHFRLHRITGGPTPQPLPGTGTPRIAITLGGPTRLHARTRTLALAAGQSAFLPAGQAVTASGPGEIHLAAPGITASTEGSS